MDEEFTRIVLDLISEMTGMSVTIVLLSKNKLYYNRLLPEFCKEIKNNISKNICTCYCHRDDQLHMCEAGLWCRSYRVGSNEDPLAYIIVGHRRLCGKDFVSRDTLHDLIASRNLNEYDQSRLAITYDEVPIIDEEDFENVLFNKLSILEEYILKEHSRAEFEKENANELRKKALDMEAKSDDLKNRTIRATHEFQIPIQSMVASSEYLLNCIKKNNPNLKCGKRSAVTIAWDLLDKLIKLSFIANNLRDIGSQNIRYDFSRVDYVAILKETIETFRGEAADKGIIIKEIVLIDGPNHKIQASEQYIRQLFFNIIHNAVKYSFETTENAERFISISCKGYVNYVSIKVSNFGVGITESELNQDRLFLQGYRGELAGDRCRIGSGLGLWISKRIVDDHNGKIRIESKQVGTGIKVDPYLTTVTIDLPVWQPMKVADDGYIEG